jgi:hypothetical protein
LFKALNEIYFFRVNSQLEYDVRNDFSTMLASTYASRSFIKSQDTFYNINLGGSYTGVQDTNSYALTASGSYNTKLKPGLLSQTSVSASASRNASVLSVNSSNSISAALAEVLTYSGVKDVLLIGNANIAYATSGMPYGISFEASTNKWKRFKIRGIVGYSVIPADNSVLAATPGGNMELFVTREGKNRESSQNMYVSLGVTGQITPRYSAELYITNNSSNSGDTQTSLDLRLQGRITSRLFADAQFSHIITNNGKSQTTSDRLLFTANWTYRKHRVGLTGFAFRDNASGAQLSASLSASSSERFGGNLFYDTSLSRYTSLFLGLTYDSDRVLGKTDMKLNTRLTWVYGKVEVQAEYEGVMHQESADAAQLTSHKVFLKVSRSFRKVL